MTLGNWSELPDHVVARILSHLNLQEKYLCCQVCKAWSEGFNHPDLWTTFTFDITRSEGNIAYPNYLEGIQQHGHLMRNITCPRTLRTTLVTSKKLTNVTLKFVGTNPLFYSGAEFIEALRKLFGYETENAGETRTSSQLTSIDLSGFAVPYDDSVVNVIALNHPNLERLNLVNQILNNKVSPDALYNLIYKCRKLKDLKIFYTSMTEENMLALADNNRLPLEHLGLSCRREVKFFRTIPSEAWTNLVAKIPNLRVTLFFDHTCPLKKVSKIMKPEIPVQILQLETYTMIYSELNQAALAYADTLEMLVVQTRYSDELGKALINISTTCHKLKELYVYCVLKRWVVEEILSNLPHLQESHHYILRWKQSPEPWTVGVEDEDPED